MAVIGSHDSLPFSFGTPGLVCSTSSECHLSSTSFSHLLVCCISSTLRLQFHYFYVFKQVEIKGSESFLQVGLALSYAAPIVSLLSSFLTSFTETEKEMVSIERALEVQPYTDSLFTFPTDY